MSACVSVCECTWVCGVCVWMCGVCVWGVWVWVCVCMREYSSGQKKFPFRFRATIVVRCEIIWTVFTVLSVAKFSNAYSVTLTQDGNNC